MTIAIIIVAAGRGTRAGGDLPKQWQPLAGNPVLAHTVACFADVGRVVLAIHPDDAGRAAGLAVQTVLGGETRAQSQTFKSTGDLPEWKKGAEAPSPLGEFPFYPDQGVDQETYAKIRAEKQAVFCYVQGMESMACVAIARDGTATKVGVQTFPG